jgi:uncharacterized protein YigE (DUF2233 family)
VEFIWPPLENDANNNLSSEFLLKIAQLALPDGSHLQEEGKVQFILSDDKITFHCMSSYRQIEASQLPQEDSISRKFV